ncbi:MAG TPA: MmoB/DmpM family protein [Kofleriaceae bacterium]|jgi:alkene monooxygenase coupling protein
MSEIATSPLEPRARDTVGISLMGSEETTAALELVRAEMPDARISDRGCFYKIEREVLLELDMAKLGEILGRPITVHQFLVNMSSYYGRIVINDGLLQIHSDILPARFRD